MIGSIIMLTLSGCSDGFFDVNENPNAPSISTPDLTLPVAQHQLAVLNAQSMTYLGNYLMYNWATPSNWSANQDFFRYNVTSTFYSNIFDVSYADIFKNLTYVSNYKDEDGILAYDRYKAIAMILKSYQYQYLVDLYGDVPFSEASLRGKNTTPKYDDAEEVYKANIDSLTAAVDMLKSLPENDANPGSADAVFGGNADRWMQFANTIKLRYLLRLTNTGQDSFIQSEVDKIQGNGAGFVTENVMINPGYSDNADKMSPFYGYFRKAGTGEQADRGDYTVATDYTMDYLFDTDDYRVFGLYAEAEKGDYKGAEQNVDLEGEGLTSGDLSKVGPGLIKEATSDQPIMLLSEALFLQAEAVVRGFLPGDAEEFYNQAITASYKYLLDGVTDDDGELFVPDYEEAAEEYYSQSVPNVGFANSGNKIEAIITQKWIALNGTSSIESWIEYNRTGFPAGLPLPVNTTRTDRPYRLLYPSSELARNVDNVPKQSIDDAFNVKIFWQK